MSTLSMKVALSDRTKMAVWAFVLFCASLVLSDFSAKNPAVVSWGAILVSEAIRPFQVGHQRTSQWLHSIWVNYIDLLGSKQENLVLKERLSELEGKYALLAELESENRQLRELLDMQQQKEYQGVIARVIGYDPSKWVRAVVVDQGSRAGVIKGMPVVTGKGVVGQVVVVTPQTARVLLIADHGSGIDVIVQNKNRSRGVLAGAGGNSCELQYVFREEKVRVGDRVSTSGIDGIYPKGLLAGTVSDIGAGAAGLFHQIEVQTVVDFDSLETVMIITNYQRHE